jgi:hypothetical protein
MKTSKKTKVNPRLARSVHFLTLQVPELEIPIQGRSFFKVESYR